MLIKRPFNNDIVVVEDFLSKEEADILIEISTKDP